MTSASNIAGTLVRRTIGSPLHLVRSIRARAQREQVFPASRTEQVGGAAQKWRSGLHFAVDLGKSLAVAKYASLSPETCPWPSPSPRWGACLGQLVGDAREAQESNVPTASKSRPRCPSRCPARL